MMKILKNIFHKTYQNESGIFTCDAEGTLLRFEPAPGNRISEPIAYYEIAVRTLIIPEGVVAIRGDFFRYGYVKDKISFPDTLRQIGEEYPIGGCTFANCYLPDVVIPSQVEIIGTFAFGKSQLKSLCMTRVPACEYLRQFKGAKIDKLILPKDLSSYKPEGVLRCLHEM